MKQGEKVYMIESNRIVRPVTIVKLIGSTAIIRFENGGGTRITLNKLYETEAQAQAKMPNAKITKHSDRWNGQLL